MSPGLYLIFKSKGICLLKGLQGLKNHLEIFFSFGAIQAAQILLPLLILPWLARILEPQAFGLLMYMCLIPPVVALVMDWGLMTGGARKAAISREDLAQHANLLGEVLSAKLLLAIFCLAICLLSRPFVPYATQYPLAWFLAFCAGIARGSSPAWFFQGLGQGMRKMACADVSASIMVLILSILFIRDNQGWPLYLFFLASCKACAYFFLILELARKYGCKLGIKSGFSAIWRTKTLFVGPLSTTICNSGTQIVMAYWLNSVQMGLIGASHKMFRALAGIANPAAQTLYPEACRLARASHKSAMKILLLSVAATFACMFMAALLAYLLAPMLIGIALGKNYEQAVHVLRAMLFAVPLMACNQMVASQGLLPLGLEKIQAVAQGIAACASLPLAAFLSWYAGIAGCAWLPLVIEIIICPILWHGLWQNSLKGLYRNQKYR